MPRKCPQKVCEVLSQFNDARTMVWNTEKGNSFDGVKENLVFPIVGNYQSLANESVGKCPSMERVDDIPSSQ